MKVEIGKIKVADRIRKQVDKIDELAADIKQNGLLNPITVMQSGGEYQLLAGLRRLRAAQLLGWTEIDVNEVSPKDAEAALRIEISENEQREEFTYSERMDYARLIEEIERAKARERMLAGKKVDDPVILGSQGTARSREVIGPKIGMSGPTYQRAVYVAEHAAPEVIEQIDSGEKTVTGVYRELRKEKNAPAPPPAPAPKPKKALPPAPVPEPVPPPETPLERAIRAEQELDAMKYRWHNEIYHRESIIENLKMHNDALLKRIDELKEALEAAQARIRELEEATA